MSERGRAARRANRHLDAIHAFCDRFAPRWLSLTEANTKAHAEIKALSETERDAYHRLLNRWVQAWNAWARLAGDRRRFPSFDRRRLGACVSPRRMQTVLPTPISHPIAPAPGAPRSRTYFEPGSGLVTEITLSNGRKRYALYDTEVYVKPSEDVFSRPPWRR